MKFKEFLSKKGVSEEDYAKKSVEEMAQLQTEYNESVVKELKDQIEKASTKEDFGALKTSFETFVGEQKDLQQQWMS